jgi:integrase
MNTPRGKRHPLTPAHAQAWQRAQDINQFRWSTIDQRDLVLRRFMAFVADYGALDPAQPLSDHITPSTVRAYLQARWDRSPNTRCEDLRFLYEAILMVDTGSDWTWLLNAVRVLRRERHALQVDGPEKTVPDRADVLAAAAAYAAPSDPPSGDLATRIRRRDAALVALVADTALRIGTAASLRVTTNLTPGPQGWFIAVGGAQTKTGQSERRPLSPDANAVLAAYFAEFPEIREEEPLWRTFTGAPMALVSVKNRFPIAMYRVSGIKLGAHSFRHAKATEAVRDDGSERAATQLGHTDASMTRRHYVRRRPDDVARSAQPIVNPFV